MTCIVQLVYGHPFVCGAGVLTILFCGLWLFLYQPYKNAHHINFDPPGGRFEHHAKRYEGLAKLVVTIETASLAGFFKFLSDIPARSDYALKIERSALLSMVFLLSSICLLLIFMAVQALFYETYCHSIKKDTYTPKQYTTTLTLGYSGLVCFFMGYAVIVLSLMFKI